MVDGKGAEEARVFWEEPEIAAWDWMGIVVIWSREKKTVSSKDVLGDKRVHYWHLEGRKNQWEGQKVVRTPEKQCWRPHQREF